VLVDTSVWVDHLRRGHPGLAARLEAGAVWCHPFVIGELACGRLRRRAEVLSLLASLPQAPIAAHAEALALLDRHDLAGRGIGWVDVHLLASARIAGMSLWTADRRLAALARELGLGPPAA
jgi:predicted nucleic acid-binding protein